MTSKEVIEKLNDDELLEKFKEVTKRSTLKCKHCGKHEYPLERFKVAIRKFCMRKGQSGLTCDTLPKTCDDGLNKNNIRNKVANSFYYAIKHAEKEDVENLRDEMFVAIATAGLPTRG